MTATIDRKSPVSSIMTTDPVSIGGAAQVSELALTLDENEISGVPVVDTLDRVIGVVSRTDVLHRCVEGPLGSRPGSYLSSLAEGLGGQIDTESLGVVSDFMNASPVTATADESIQVVAHRMIEERVHRVIIVDNNRHLQGIVSTQDMLRLVAE